MTEIAGEEGGGGRGKDGRRRVFSGDRLKRNRKKRKKRQPAKSDTLLQSLEPQFSPLPVIFILSFLLPSCGSGRPQHQQCHQAGSVSTVGTKSPAKVNTMALKKPSTQSFQPCGGSREWKARLPTVAKRFGRSDCDACLLAAAANAAAAAAASAPLAHRTSVVCPLRARIPEQQNRL